MAKILVLRFTAIGDVAMTVPIVHALATQYPNDEVIMVSRKQMQPLFESLPNNVTFIGADLKGEHNGITGLMKLYRQLKQMGIDYVADLHFVLRSRLITSRFRMLGIPCAIIDKGRIGKHKLTRRTKKVMERQRSSFMRYADVFAELGFPVAPNFTSIYGEGNGPMEQIQKEVGTKGETKWVGIAPFAKHNGKIYPLDKMEQVIAALSSQNNTRLFLFGGGKKEESVFNDWVKKYSNIESMAGRLDMKDELSLMSHLDVMLSMDSANMHLASLVNTEVISIWGQTHPYAGFLGWKQLPVNTIQCDLSCRPCSVYGNKECYRKDFACMNNISPETIISKVLNCIK